MLIRIKTTLGVRDALPGDLQGVFAKAKDDDVWLDYGLDQVLALKAALNEIHARNVWPNSYNASRTIEAVDRALRANEKAQAKVNAAASGALDPEVKITLEKMLKAHNVGSVKKILAAFDLLGVTVTELPPAQPDAPPERWEREKRMWAVRVGDLPPVDIEASRLRTGKFAPADYDLANLRLPFGPYGESADTRQAREAPYLVARRALRELIAAKLGFPLPEDEEKARVWRETYGFEAPPRPKARKHGDWTCGYCWRVHAVNGAGRLVHHGYQRPGVGHIIGDCPAVGEEPWERSTVATAQLLGSRQLHAASVADRLARGYTKIEVREYNPKTKAHIDVWIDRNDPRWVEAEKVVRRQDLQLLTAYWSGLFCSVPWLRGAIRTWKREEIGAVGYPDVTCIPEDFAGRPSILDKEGA